MDHTYIRERNIADLYLLGQLSAEERATFEEHYFDCEECVRTLELARGFQSGMRDAVLDRPRRVSTPWRVTLAFAAGVLLMILPATLLRKAPQPDLAPRQTVRLSEPDGVEVYMLNTPRGTSQTPEISLPSRPHLMVFLLDQQPDPAIPSYTARLLDSDGKLVWHQDDVKPGQRSTFAVGVRSDLLHPGEYSLTLAPLGSYRFRVVSKTP